MHTRLERLERQVRDRPDPRLFTTVQAVTTNVDPRPPGLYRHCGPGSTSGLLVFDPALGEQVMPEGRLAPDGLFIISGPNLDPEPEPL